MTDISRKSICLVGHGRSPIGKGQGKYIDSHDVVLRFLLPLTSFNTLLKAEDYGDRLDIWMVTELGLEANWLSQNPRSFCELWIYNKLVAGESIWNDTVVLDADGSISIKRDDGIIKQWLCIYNGFPRRPKTLRHYSRGMAAIIMAAASGEYDPITLVGLDAMTAPKENVLYGTVLGKKGPVRNMEVKMHHDFEAEGQMLPMIQEKYGVAIQW